ncbi:MFS transporter [Brachybacterium sp. AOP43-C2-M15]|uniref:MFS transporter n=1 Tax=Brachybacterium sp. AOP43-C2-M15 TaxID=3457661 RepID=UPI0040333F1B
MTNTRLLPGGATSRAASATDPTPDPAADPRRWKALGVLAAGLALIVIDGSIVAVSLPAIITDLSLDLADAQWVTTSYAVVLSALLLISGRVGDRLGRRRLFLAGVLVFVAASVLAALASGAGSLIAARLLQGVGGALILPSTLSTVNATFRGTERAAAFGVWGAVMAGAAALGPLLGGWLTSSFSWPWIFLVNVPIGLAVVGGTLAWVGETREVPREMTDRSAARSRSDVLGAVLSALALGSLVFAVIEAGTLGWWTQVEPLTIGGLTVSLPGDLSVVPPLLLAGLALLGAFLGWERRRTAAGREVLLDLTLFRLPAFAWGNLTAGTVAIGEFGLLFVLPLYLVDVLALGTLQAGLVLAAMAGGAFASGTAARHLSARIGAPGTVLAGLVLEVAGVGVLALTLGPATSIPLIVGVLVVYGLGLGLASAQLTSTVLAPVPVEQSGQGSATQSTVRQLGTALGTAISGALLAAGLATRADALTGEAAGLGRAMTDSAGAVLPQLRAQGTDAGTLDQLGTLFADGTRIALLGSAGFLLLGLLGALLVARAARRTPSRRTPTR